MCGFRVGQQSRGIDLLHHGVNLRRAIKVMQAGGFSRGKLSALQINYSAEDDKAEPQKRVEYQ
jgi:hypothetical protein